MEWACDYSKSFIYSTLIGNDEEAIEYIDIFEKLLMVLLLHSRKSNIKSLHEESHAKAWRFCWSPFLNHSVYINHGFRLFFLYAIFLWLSQDVISAVLDPSKSTIFWGSMQQACMFFAVYYVSWNILVFQFNRRKKCRKSIDL